MAILLDEPLAAQCSQKLEDEEDVLISAGTLAEALIVAERRNVRTQLVQLVEGLGFNIVPLTAKAATDAADAYGLWGKGLHPAGLNFGDCFAYAVARAHDCALLFVGDDFSKTDVKAALNG